MTYQTYHVWDRMIWCMDMMYYTTIWWYLALGSGPCESCEHESQYSQRECRCYRVIPYYRVTQPFGWGALDRSCWTWCLPWTSWAASGIWFRSSSRSLPIWPLLSLTPYYGTPAAWCSRQWIPASQVWVLLRPFIIRERTCWWRPIRSDGPSPWSLRSPPRWRQLAMALTWSRQLEMMMTVTAPLLLRSTTMKETMPQSWSHNLPAKRLTPVPAWPLLPRPGREATTKWRKTIGRLQATMTSFSWSHGLFPATMIGCKRILRSGKATRSTRGNPPLKSVLPWPIQWQLNRYWPLWVVWNLICCQRLSQRWRPQSVGPTNSQEELIWVSSEQWSNQEAFNSSVEPLDWSSASAATRTLIKVSWCSTFSIFGLLCLICLHSFQVFQVLGVYRVYMSLYTFQKISESFFFTVYRLGFSTFEGKSFRPTRHGATPRASPVDHMVLRMIVLSSPWTVPRPCCRMLPLRSTAQRERKESKGRKWRKTRNLLNGQKKRFISLPWTMIATWIPMWSVNFVVSMRENIWTFCRRPRVERLRVNARSWALVIAAPPFTSQTHGNWPPNQMAQRASTLLSTRDGFKPHGQSAWPRTGLGISVLYMFLAA